MPIRLRTYSPEMTRTVAGSVQPLLRPGDILLLSGDLGGGKTVFVQGLAAAMGIVDPVTSPTFVLSHAYEGAIRLHHVDVYRFERSAEVIDLDLPELFSDDAITAIEWGERVIDEIPPDYLVIRIDLGLDDEPADVRILEFAPVGASWLERGSALATALAPFSPE
jgi:tRNA threonylcarbamoyladenosine biosynthesis protein TsaE